MSRLRTKTKTTRKLLDALTVCLYVVVITTPQRCVGLAHLQGCSGNDIYTKAKGKTHATKGHDDRDSAVAFLRNLVMEYRRLRRDNPDSDDPLFGRAR